MSDDAEKPVKKNVPYLAILLGGFATLAAGLLIAGNNLTHDEIRKRLMEDTQRSLNQVIPTDIHDNNLLNDKITVKDHGKDIEVYRATKDDKVVAVAYQTTGQGYGGAILLIMGVKADGSILGVRVLSHSETPGLGDRIEEKKSRWIYIFNGHSLENTTSKQWAVKKDGGIFDQFSGATITPRGVVKAVKQGLTFFKMNSNQLTSVSKETASTETKSK